MAALHFGACAAVAAENPFARGEMSRTVETLSRLSLS
jgi:hypothetical protein